MDAFSRCHPAVTVSFFAIAAIGSMIWLHPLYLAASLVCAALYHLILLRNVRRILLCLPLCAAVALLNPLFSTYGRHTLFMVLGRPYTYEALCYGIAVAAMLLAMLLWLQCFSHIVTSDKITALLGKRFPALSLLLVMVLRLIPAYGRKARVFSHARRSLRQESGLRHASSVLTALTGWALESGLITADSMRARGYGVVRPTRFRPIRFTLRDGALLLLIGLLVTLTGVCSALGGTHSSYLPVLEIARSLPTGIGAASYTLLLSLPLILHGKEALQWRSFAFRN